MSSTTVERTTTGIAAWWPVPATLVAGLAVGFGTQILQGVLPDAWGVLANSGVVWALTAFVFGATLPSARWAAMGGAAQLLIASIVYYVAVDWLEGSSSDPRGAIIWSVAGITAGSVFGIAGHWFAHRVDRRDPALALVAGAMIGEGARLTWFIGNPSLRPAGIAELAVAATLASACLAGSIRSSLRRNPVITTAVVAVAATATLVAGKVIDCVFGAS